MDDQNEVNRMSFFSRETSYLSRDGLKIEKSLDRNSFSVSESCGVKKIDILLVMLRFLVLQERLSL